jgi:hypothetical protein
MYTHFYMKIIKVYTFFWATLYIEGRAMVQGVSRWPFPAVARVRPQVRFVVVKVVLE